MKNIINTSKRSIILILTLCILLCTSGIGVHAISMPEENIAVTEEITVVVEESTVSSEEPRVSTEDTAVVTEEKTQELVPMMARACSYNHYEVTSSWPNGNVRTVTYWLVDEQGNRIGTTTWVASYPETGPESMSAYGTPGGFAGCKCPNCR